MMELWFTPQPEEARRNSTQHSIAYLHRNVTNSLPRTVNGRNVLTMWLVP
jgi:hypothetical protein